MQKNDSNKVPQFWAIIPAAGTGQRMHADVPKTYLPLGECSVIEACLSSFLQEDKITGIVVAIHPNDQYWEKLTIISDKPILTVLGGVTRAQSVSIALDLVIENSGLDDFVLVHDAARPCLQMSDLKSLLNNIENETSGRILATPIVDTIKEVSMSDKNIRIKKTLDRCKLWKALTPQMFRTGVLRKALDHCFEKQIIITDEASAVEAIGLEVGIIEGRSDNIKITHSEDIQIAESILSNVKTLTN